MHLQLQEVHEFTITGGACTYNYRRCMHLHTLNVIQSWRLRSMSFVIRCYTIKFVLSCTRCHRQYFCHHRTCAVDNGNGELRNYIKLGSLNWCRRKWRKFADNVSNIYRLFLQHTKHGYA